MGRKSHTWAPLMIMMRENPLLRPLEGAGPKILNFSWTQMALASLSLSLPFEGPPLPIALKMDFPAIAAM